MIPETERKKRLWGFRKIYGVFTHLSIVLGSLIIFFLAGVFFLEGFRKPSVIVGLIILTSAFLGMMLAMARFLVKKLHQIQASTEDLKRFKDFILALHSATTETEVYGVLFDYIRRIPQIQQTTLFYRMEFAVEDATWRKISSAELPLCSLSSNDACPADNQLQVFRIESAGVDLLCNFQSDEYKGGSYICLPILQSGHVQSVLQLYSKKENAFNEAVITRIKTYIDITVPVLQSKRTLHLLNKKATTDKLTKVYNRSFLDPYLENQMEAANLSNQQLSVIMLDIDRFKSVNDTWGHGAGDFVLVLFTEITLKCIRKSDLVARYGGDEFIVVLPSTDLETARTIAERIRQTLEETHVPPVDGAQIPPVTCSLGLACYPLHSSSMDQLIKCCDTALYKAKQGGRNKVVVYGQGD